MKLTLNETQVDDAYLAETTYCNYTDPSIVTLARSLAEAGGTTAEVASRIFYWVREHVEYRLANWNWTASQTLQRRIGCCTNKANLFIALCRAVGIPAAYYVMHVHGKYYMGPVVTPLFRRRFGERSVHIHAAIFVEGRWVQCDPTDESSFVRAIGHLSHSCILVDFDGQRDALLNILPEHVNRVEGPLANIDHIFSKRTSHGPMHVVYDEFIGFLRAHGPNYSVATLDLLEVDFLRALYARAPAAYHAFTKPQTPRGNDAVAYAHTAREMR